MIFLQLFLSFVKIGFTSFGGMSMVPLIMDEMTAHGWMTSEDLSNLVAIAEMTPGPLGINCATFAGNRSAGIAGGLAAVLGVLVPSFTIAFAAAVFYERFRESSLMRHVMSYVKPVCIAMLINVILSLGRDAYYAGGTLQPASIAIAAVSLYLLMRRKWPIPKVIGTAAAMGVLLCGVLPML